MSDMRSIRSGSCGDAVQTWRRKRWFILQMICKWRRGKGVEQIDAHCSSASGNRGVVGIGERRLCDLPAVSPVDTGNSSTRDAHELRNRNTGMGVVELDRRLVRQLQEGERRNAPESCCGPGCEVPAQKVGDRARDKDRVLLLEAGCSLPTTSRSLGGTLRLMFSGKVLVEDRALVVAGVEHRQVELLAGA